MIEGASLQIEQIKEKTGLSYIDSVIYFCNQNGFETDEIAEELHPALKEKLKFEFRELHMVREKNENSLEEFE